MSKKLFDCRLSTKIKYAQFVEAENEKEARELFMEKFYSNRNSWDFEDRHSYLMRSADIRQRPYDNYLIIAKYKDGSSRNIKIKDYQRPTENEAINIAQSFNTESKLKSYKLKTLGSSS